MSPISNSLTLGYRTRLSLHDALSGIYQCYPFPASHQGTVQCYWGSETKGAKKIIFAACHSGKLKLAFSSPDVILTSPKNFLTSRINFTVLLLFEFLKKHHLPVGQVKNRIHSPNSKIHQPQAIGHYFLCTLETVHCDDCQRGV